MKAVNLSKLSVLEMLGLYADILAELQGRGVVRTANSPVGDYAEKLAQSALGLKAAGGSQKGYDAVGTNGVKYQIKARRLATWNTPRQLSAIRNLEEKRFDFLVGILFHPDFRVMKGCLIPHSVVLEKSTDLRKHTNARVFYLNDNVWDVSGVKDVTAKLQKTQAKDA